MASHQISIRQEVFIRLKKAKKPGESYSDMIARLLNQESNVERVLNCYGKAGSGEDPEDEIVLEIYRESKAEIRAAFQPRASRG